MEDFLPKSTAEMTTLGDKVDEWKGGLKTVGTYCLYGVGALFGIAVLAMIWFCWRSAGRSNTDRGAVDREQGDVEAGVDDDEEESKEEQKARKARRKRRKSENNIKA